MEFGISGWRTYEQGIEREWLLTNGIGGYASSTLTGSNTRRYHGLLVASLKPPVQRHLILSKVDETVEIGGRMYDLYSYEAGGVVKKGFHNLVRFVWHHLPTYVYSIGDTIIEKTICLVHGENTAVVLYHVINGQDRLKLRLTPLVNFRDHHQDSHREHMKFTQKPHGYGTVIDPYGLGVGIDLYCSGGNFTPLENCWFENMEYAVERERGLHSSEDHYIPGYFDIEIMAGKEEYITLSTTIEKGVRHLDGRLAVESERARLKALEETAGYSDKFASSLAAAADNFIVYRKSTESKTIIAGYPWFTDWGRDTMIALPGLTLATGRFEDARKILGTFAKYVKGGLMPNVFPDEGSEPAYNSVDAPLWYFEAVSKYLAYTGDMDFITRELLSSLEEIYHSFEKGVEVPGHSGSFIRMENDFLVSAGSPETQLTWMDAKVGWRTITPRHGKAVEINALWYNASRVMEKLTQQQSYRDNAERTREAFVRSFWNEPEACLCDVVTKVYDNGRITECRDGRVRPNQVVAAGLSYPVIEGDMARLVVEKVWKELYTPYGLRTLSRRSEGYSGCCTGDQCARDEAYHQGTVWVWPMGQFITAFKRAFGSEGIYREIMSSFFKPFSLHLEEACLGNISEIFDGDPPYYPRGCFAQAWSVGEILRSYTEDML